MSVFALPTQWLHALGLVYAATFGCAASVVWMQRRRMQFIAHSPRAAMALGASAPIAAKILTSSLPSQASSAVWSLAWGAGALLLGYAMYGLRASVAHQLAERALFQASMDGAIVLDAHRRIVEINPAASRMMRLSPERLLGLALHELAANTNVDLSKANESPILIEISRDGLPSRWYEVTSRAFALGVGAGSGWLYILRDVTDVQLRERELQNSRNELESKIAERTLALCHEIEQRKSTEAALAKSEHRFRAVFEQAFQLVGVTDPQGTLLDANRSALAIINVELRDVVGRHFAETPWWSAEESRRLRTALTAAAQGVFVRYEATIMTADGGSKTLDFSLKPVKDDHGDVIFVIPEGRDITELRRSEQERQSLAAELHQSQRLEDLGRLAGSVAHDFDNLLTVIGGNLALLEASSPDWPDKFDLRGTVEATRRAGELTRQLLAFSRRQIAEPRVFDPAESLNGMRKLLPRIVSDDISLKLTITGEPGPVFMDPAQFEQIVTNLVMNARDAMPSGGHLDVTLSRIEMTDAKSLPDGLTRAGTYACLAISDTGAGIPDTIVPHLFEPFFTTKSPGAGTGLGLATVHGIVTQAMGTIAVDSKMGWGTTFRIFLPCCDSNPIAPRRDTASATVGTLGRVLLVEDQESVRDLLVRVLMRYRFEVIAHAEGNAALAYARNTTNHFDLVLTDVVMPEMSGRELADALRRIRPSVPIVFMSGHTDDAVLRTGIEEAREFFLSKPFAPQVLAEKLRAILQIARTHSSI